MSGKEEAGVNFHARHDITGNMNLSGRLSNRPLTLTSFYAARTNASFTEKALYAGQDTLVVQ